MGHAFLEENVSFVMVYNYYIGKGLGTDLIDLMSDIKD